MLHQQVSPRWTDLVVVAATGPSLTHEVAEQCMGHRVIAVSDAHRLMPWADVCYSCDARWWNAHNGTDFQGEKWSCHGAANKNDKREAARKWGLNLVHGKDGDGFSLDPSLIHYGRNSGFQAVNLAGHFMGWRGVCVLVGFNLRQVAGRKHFFGDHPKGLTNTSNPERWVPEFVKAAKRLPSDFTIINATPDSALKCFPMMELSDALSYEPRHRPADACGHNGIAVSP